MINNNKNNNTLKLPIFTIIMYSFIIIFEGL